MSSPTATTTTTPPVDQNASEDLIITPDTSFVSTYGTIYYVVLSVVVVFWILCIALAITGIVVSVRRCGMLTLLILNSIGIVIPIFGLVCGPIAIATKGNYKLKDPVTKCGILSSSSSSSSGETYYKQY